MQVPSWYTHDDDACFLRACVSGVSLALFSSRITLRKQTNFGEQLFVQRKHKRVSSSKSVKSLINYQTNLSVAALFSKENTDFSRHTDFAFSSLLLRLLSFFLSFFLSFRAFPFRERERERTFLRFRARESERFLEQRERLFYENVLLLGTKMGTKSTASFRRRRTRRTTTTTQRVDGGNDATPHRGFTDGEAAVDELGEDDTNYC